jgi:lysophospholipase L1-like esterase
MSVQLADNVDPLPGAAPRLYTVYLPLYNGVESLEIGIPSGASFRGIAPRKEKPILFYGTSIMHGACASRTGMSISAIVGRRFKRPVINLGFSGNGQMEPEVGALLAELDPAVYALDCLPNMTPEMVASRTEPLVRQLRTARPNTPILLVEDRTFTNAGFIKSTRQNHEARRKAYHTAFENLRSAGVTSIGYLKGENLVGLDGEGATDGSHPNDLGMVRYADGYEKALRPFLRRS